MDGPTIMMLTVVGVLAYGFIWMLLIKLLARLTRYMSDDYSSLGGRLILFIPFVALAVLCIVVDIFHSILLAMGGYTAMVNFRDWWNRAAK